MKVPVYVMVFIIQKDYLTDCLTLLCSVTSNVSFRFLLLLGLFISNIYHTAETTRDENLGKV